VVLLGEGGDLERGLAAMREGAADFQAGVVIPDKVVAVLERGFAEQARGEQLADARARLDGEFGLARLAGHSAAMHRVLEQAAQIAATRSPLLIEGEPGSGKRRMAQAIHQSGPRSDEPFAWVACLGLSAEDAEAELFGREDAATGAVERVGRFERAEGGTLFLDEVAALPAAAQAALLRAIHDRSFVPQGAREPRRADVRLIAATARDLAGEVAAGRFRADLYERLAVVRMSIPPLRERAADLPALVAQLIAEIAREQGKRVSGMSRGALECLAAHAWPGNVCELRNALEAAIAGAAGRGPLRLSDFPEGLRGAASARTPIEAAVGMTVEEVERRLIEATLAHAAGDKRRAAALLGIGLRTLYRKIREYGLA
jgi:DNA-binding NtrC family response regulator